MQRLSHFQYETTVHFPAEYADEIDVTVSFDVSWGRPSRYDAPYEDDEVSDIRLIQVGGRFRPWGLHNWSDSHFAELVSDALFASERDLERMLEKAREEEACVEDVISERKWVERCDLGVA
jgi:hypothetical protein